MIACICNNNLLCGHVVCVCAWDTFDGLFLFSIQLLIGYEHSYFELWDAMTWKPITIFGPLKVNTPLSIEYNTIHMYVT